MKQSGLARRRIDDDDDDDEADEEAVLDGGVFVFLQNHSKEDESSKEEHFFTDAKETLNALRQRQKKRSEKREDDRCTIEVQTMMSASPSAVVNCSRISVEVMNGRAKKDGTTRRTEEVRRALAHRVVSGKCTLMFGETEESLVLRVRECEPSSSSE